MDHLEFECLMADIGTRFPAHPSSKLKLPYLFYVKIIISHFGGTWKVPFTPIVIVILLISVSCVAAVYAPAKRIHGMAITETINEL